MTTTQALALAFQFVNQSMSDLAIDEMAEELKAYPESHVLASLKRCRSELKAIRFCDILDRLPGGHPGPEEAWAIAHRTIVGKKFEENEQASVVWTDEIRDAFSVARALSDDAVAARVAFKEKYVQLVSEARSKRLIPNWIMSLGYDKGGREVAVREAVERGRLTHDQAYRLVPSLPAPMQDVMPLVARIIRCTQ
jgi:hypothetical protein